MKRQLLGILLVPALIAGSFTPSVVASAVPQPAQEHGRVAVKPAIRHVTLVAEPGKLTIRPGQSIPVWTYNGTVPGPGIMARQGDRLVVTLVNKLPEATTIHWHGLLGPNSVDGVAGVTQNAVLPGKQYTYSFVANQPGTYWYHPHQKSDQQEGKGLYGALIVLPRSITSRPALDRTLMLGEWALPAATAGISGGMGATTMSSPPAPLRPYLADTGMEAYRTFTVNGKAYPSTTPITGPAGTTVRLRLINAGNLTHILSLGKVPYQLVATDGSPITSPSPTTDLLPIAAGQRLDVAFTMPTSAAALQDVSGLPGASDLRVPLGQAARTGQTDAMETEQAANRPLLNLANYGQPAAATFSTASRFDRVFRLVIGQTGSTAMAGMADMRVTYTINGASFPRTTPVPVRAGQRIELQFVSKSKDAHPMHLHGHRFQVLVLNGVRVSGSPLYLDTVMVLPGKTTAVAFVADNPGIWALHCHEQHHAASGLVTLVRYQGVTQHFTPGGPTGNVPE